MENNNNTTTSSNAKKQQIAMGVSLVEHLTDIYHNIFNEEDNEHVTDYENLTSRFAKKYGSQPQFFVRVPGLLYLFGEDPSYAQYDQSNIAIERDIVLAYSKDSNSSSADVTVNCLSSTQFPEKKFNLDSPFVENDHLGNVALLGIKSALEGQNQQKLVGLKCMFSNSIPRGQTFHSTNALALAMCLMVLHANNIALDCKQVLQNCEKFKKVMNVPPSMDEKYEQIALFAQKNTAYLGNITQGLPIPKGKTFIIANSLTPEPKMLVAGSRKNKRICEQRIAVHLILAGIGIKLRDEYQTLLEVQDLQEFSTEEMLQCIDKYIEDKPLTKVEIEEILETDMINIMQDVPYSNQVIEGNPQFFPYKRAKHIVSEALKAEKMREICLNQGISDEQKWEELYKLFADSQKSIAENLEAQSEECTKLSQLMKQLGCKAAKVIGDGWGGSVVGIADDAKADKIIEFIMDEYYLNKSNNLMISDDLSSYVFKTLPSRGAVILNPSYEIWF